MNSKSFNILSQLFQEYYHAKNITSDEFIEAKLVGPDAINLTEAEIEKFVLLVTHKNFLDAIKNDFVAFHNLRHYSDTKIIMTIFVILFASDCVNIKDLFEVFLEMKCAFKTKLLQYFWNDNNLIQTALTGCKFFEDEYVLEKIINPILNKIDVFRKVHEFLVKEKIKQRNLKPPTVPKHMEVLERATTRPPPAVPLNTPVGTTFFETDERISYNDHFIISRRLMGEYEKNRKKAEKLLEQAKSLDKNYCKEKKSVAPEEPPTVRFKAKKAPRMKQIETKGNVATVLREASLCIKEQEKEIRTIEAIIQGSGTLDKYKALEENVRELEQKKSIEDIERKHLEGLLTFEEAVLAKQKLVECNKERFKRFMQERELFLEEMEKWKEDEEERIRQMVEKSQEIERKAKESEKKCKRDKKNKVDQFKDETRKLLLEAQKKQEEELARKVKLIQEIKTLHQLRTLHSVKETETTESPDFGLLSQLSLAELQQKLIDFKVKMEEELEQKRKCIQKYREKQRRMIENVKNFITQTRMSKPKQRTFVPVRPAKLERNPALDRLRSELETKREQRRSKTVKCEEDIQGRSKTTKRDGIPCTPSMYLEGRY